MCAHFSSSSAAAANVLTSIVYCCAQSFMRVSCAHTRTTHTHTQRANMRAHTQRVCLCKRERKLSIRLIVSRQHRQRRLRRVHTLKQLFRCLNLGRQLKCDRSHTTNFLFLSFSFFLSLVAHLKFRSLSLVLAANVCLALEQNSRSR